MINELLRRFAYTKLIELAQRTTGIRPHYKAQYGLYLQGPRWFILRNLRLMFDGYRCTKRGPHAGPLQAHHTTYDHKDKGLGWAEFWSLRTLCKKHHEEEHGIGD